MATRDKPMDAGEAQAHLVGLHSMMMRDELRAYLEQLRANTPLTSDGAYERARLDRWIAWLRRTQ